MKIKVIENFLHIDTCQVETNSTFFTRSVFTKKDLINLCHAYNIK
jgi:hypothetical protein